MFHLSLQFTLEDARERLNSLHQGSGSPASDRRQLAASRLDPASVREQRHSIHVLTSSSPTPASHGEYCSLLQYYNFNLDLIIFVQIPIKVY